MDNPENLEILKILVQTDEVRYRSAILNSSTLTYKPQTVRVGAVAAHVYVTANERYQHSTSTAPAPLRTPLIWIILKIWKS